MLHRTSSFTWIIFLDVCPTDASKTSYNVPYNCLFMIVCPKNAAHFIILETFEVKKKIWIMKFGIWEDSFGLTISKKFFYDRRMNLNGTELLINKTPDNVSKNNNRGPIHSKRNVHSQPNR